MRGSDTVVESSPGATPLNVPSNNTNSGPGSPGFLSSQFSKEQQDELLCTYAALILHDDGKDIDPDSMNKMIQASGNSVESYWPMLMAKMCNNVGVEKLLKTPNSKPQGDGGGDAPAQEPEHRDVVTGEGGASGSGDAPAQEPEHGETGEADGGADENTEDSEAETEWTLFS